jgi:branched-chain amino acid transport system substrate-binding protein
MIRVRLLLSCLMIAAALPARADILVGVAGPMSGTFFAVGDEMRAGVEAAVAEINAAGGLDGERLAVEVVDDKCAAETGAAVANQLVGMGAKLVVGHACTAAALPAANVYAENGIVLISPAATNPRFTDERVGPGVFRMASRSDRQPQAIADRLLSVHAGKRVGFVHDGSVYGQGLVDAVRTAYEAAGGKAVMTEPFTSGEKSQITLAGIIQDAALSVVVMGALQADAAVVAREVRDRGLTAELIGGEAVGLEEFIALAGPAGEGVVFTAPRDWRREPGAARALEAIRTAGVEPTNTALLAYAAVQAYAAAAEGDQSFEAVTRLLAEEAVPTVIGPVAFDPKGDLEGAGYELEVWRNGRPEPLP